MKFYYLFLYYII